MALTLKSILTYSPSADFQIQFGIYSGSFKNMFDVYFEDLSFLFKKSDHNSEKLCGFPDCHYYVQKL